MRRSFPAGGYGGLSWKRRPLALRTNSELFSPYILRCLLSSVEFAAVSGARQHVLESGVVFMNRITVIGVYVAAGLAGLANAQSVVLENGVNGYLGCSDTSLYEDRADNSNGGFEFVFSGKTLTNFTRRALLRFELGTALPAGAQITSVSLRMVVDQSRPATETHTLHRVTSNWTEGITNSGEPGGLGIAANAGDATWTHRNWNTLPWSTAGGDYVATASGDGQVMTSGTVSWFSGAGMVADVQAWSDGTQPNFGWILRGNESSLHNAKRLVSSEGYPGFRPQLHVHYIGSAGVNGWRLYE